MTVAFGAITLGAIFIYMGFTGRSLADLALDKPADESLTSGDIAGISASDINSPSSVLTSAPASTGGGASKAGGGGGGASQAGSGKHPSGVVVWPHGQRFGEGGKSLVCRWMVPYLNAAMKRGWDGNLSSGYRSPAYSESLCQNMCGAPSCPGVCAGTSSNHSGDSFPGGAIDVVDYGKFGQIMAQIHAPLKNALPADQVHFSFSGR